MNDILKIRCIFFFIFENFVIGEKILDILYLNKYIFVVDGYIVVWSLVLVWLLLGILCWFLLFDS